MRKFTNAMIRVPFRRRRGSVRVPPWRTVAAVTLVASIGLLLGACGSTGPGVAGLVSTTSTTNVSSASLSSQLVKYGACIRSHGIPQYPDPMQNGDSFTFMKVNSPQFAIVQAACHNVLPADVLPPLEPTITPVDQADYLRAVACLHSDGFPQIPDPTFTAGKVHISLPSSIDQRSPRFERALATCRRLIPRGLPYSD